MKKYRRVHEINVCIAANPVRACWRWRWGETPRHQPTPRRKKKKKDPNPNPREPRAVLPEAMGVGVGGGRIVQTGHVAGEAVPPVAARVRMCAPGCTEHAPRCPRSRARRAAVPAALQRGGHGPRQPSGGWARGWVKCCACVGRGP